MPTAIRSHYGKIANVYDAFLTLSGFKRGVEQFLASTPFHLPPRARILDAGCGTGLVSIFLAGRFPDASILAFDINTPMLRELERIALRKGLVPSNAEGIDRRSFTIAQGDLRTPEVLQALRTRERVAIPSDHFDAVFVSGALEHVELAETIQRLAKLLKPGGIFFNLGVRKNPAGAVLGMVYRFKPYGVTELRRACETAGLSNVRTLRLTHKHFPANLSRVAIMAEKLESGK